MEISEHDIKMFYTLFSHYNKLSPNIAVVGSIEKVQRQYKEIIEKCNKNHIPVIVNKDKLIIRIITEDGIECNYIRVKEIDDLKSMTFRKFI